MARQKLIGYANHTRFGTMVPIKDMIRQFQDKYDYSPKHIIFPPTHKITEQDVKDAGCVKLMQEEVAGYWAFVGPTVESGKMLEDGRK